MTTDDDNRARASILAVITARGGSKRIPGKNIKPFAGRPMIAWPIEAAKASGIFDRIVVSTDSEEIAAVARGLGAEVPFLRPAELSDEFTPTAPVFEHAIQWFLDAGVPIQKACCIYPTAPFLSASDLRAGYDLVVNAGAPAAISVTTFDFPILRSFRVDGVQQVLRRVPSIATSFVKQKDSVVDDHEPGEVRLRAIRQKASVNSDQSPKHAAERRVEPPEEFEACE